MASNLIASTQWPAPSALSSYIAANVSSPPPKADTTPAARSPSAISHQTQPDPRHTLALQVQHNLQYQHDWSDVRFHTHKGSLHQTMRDWRSSGSHKDSGRSPSTGPTSTYNIPRPQDHTTTTNGTEDTPDTLPDGEPLSRPLLTGTPPHHLYIHPGVQTALIKAGKREESLPIQPVIVCPSHIREGGWTLERMAGVFEQVPTPERGWLGDLLGVGGGEGGGEGRQDALSKGIVGGDGSVEGEDSVGLDEKKRLLLAVVESDSTVVYYWVHDGLVKPRQN